jgi:hypothetical protein
MSARIAAEVRAEMARQNVKQTRIARDVFNTYPQKMQQRFAGTIPFGAAELLAIADYLRVDVVQFLSAGSPNRPGGDSGTGSVSAPLVPPFLTLIRGDGAGSAEFTGGDVKPESRAALSVVNG